MPGFRQQYKKQKQDLLRRHEESVADKGDGQFGSIIDSSKLPKGIGFWKCSDEQHIVDFIPFIAGPNMPKVSGKGVQEGEFIWLVDLWVHWNVGVLEHPYVCLAKTNGEPCPICEHLQQNNTYTKDEYNAIKAKHRTIYLIWCHDNSTEKEKGIQLWEVAHYFMEYNLKEIAERGKGGGTTPYFDPDVGKNVRFTRRGKGAGNTEFLGHTFLDRDTPEIPNKILDQSFSLDSVVKYALYDEIHEAFYGAQHDGGPVGETGVGEEVVPFEQDLEPEPGPTTEVEVVSDECPIGGEFGVDHNTFEQCDEGSGCVNWDNCFAANQEMQEPAPEPTPEPVPEPATQRAQLRTPKAEKPTPIKKPIKRRRN